MSKNRELLILDEIIRHYTFRQEALSARRLAKQSNLSLSPTTIRNLMDDLSQLGLLTTEGAVRGRIPTQKAYQIHLDGLKLQKPQLRGSGLNIDALDESTGKHLEYALRQVGQFLMEESGLIAVAFLPSRDDALLDWVRLFALEDNQVLVCVRTLFGELWSKLLRSQKPFSQSLLDEVQGFLNETYHRRSLRKIRQDVMRGKPQSVLADMVSVGSAFRMLRRAFEWDNTPRWHFWGQEKLYRWPQYNHPLRLEQLNQILNIPLPLLSALQQGRRMQLPHAASEDLADSPQKSHSFSSKAGSELRIAIGSELGIAGLEDFSLTGCSFQHQGWQGWLALLGPIWMNYAQNLALAHQAADSLNQWLDSL